MKKISSAKKAARVKKPTKKISKKAAPTAKKKVKKSKIIKKAKPKATPKAIPKVTLKAKLKETQPIKYPVKQPVPVMAPSKPATRPGKMSEFQQCVVLAAVINQERNATSEFQAIPLPEVNSTMFAPLRLRLAEYAFTESDIIKAVDDLLHSEEFKQAFPVKNAVKENIFIITKNKPKEMMAELLELAGSESKKTIYIIETGLHGIQKTTLEKHALKTDQIEAHPLHPVTSQPNADNSLHKQLVLNMKQQKNNRYFGNNPQNISGKQHRGRG